MCHLDSRLQLWVQLAQWAIDCVNHSLHCTCSHSDASRFQAASYGFAVFSIVAPLILAMFLGAALILITGFSLLMFLALNSSMVSRQVVEVVVRLKEKRKQAHEGHHQESQSNPEQTHPSTTSSPPVWARVAFIQMNFAEKSVVLCHGCLTDSKRSHTTDWKFMAEAFTTYEYEITTARRIQSTRLIANKMAMAETEIKSEGSRK